MLHQREAVLANLERIVEGTGVASILKYDLSVLRNLLLSTKHTIVELNCVVPFIQVELPDKEDFRPIIKRIINVILVAMTYDLMFLPTSRLS